MATISKQPVEIARVLSGGPPALLSFGEASGQTFKRGEFVYLVNGLVTIYAANGTQILGIAMENAAGVAGTPHPIALASDTNIFVANVNAGVTALAQIGLSYALVTASAMWHVDTTSWGTNARVLVVGLDSRDTVGDTTGRVHFIVLNKYRQLDTTS